MFNAVIPLAPPVIAVQVETRQMDLPHSAELLTRLEKFFMSPVVLVNWDEAGQFKTTGHPCPEEMLTDEDLVWREFELLSEPDIPF